MYLPGMIESPSKHVRVEPFPVAGRETPINRAVVLSAALAIIDGEGVEDDHLELMEIAMDGNWELCDRCLVVGKDPCPFCGREMHHYYDSKHKPSQWQECPCCGHVVDMTLEGGEVYGK